MEFNLKEKRKELLKNAEINLTPKVLEAVKIILELVQEQDKEFLKLILMMNVFDAVDEEYIKRIAGVSKIESGNRG